MSNGATGGSCIVCGAYGTRLCHVDGRVAWYCGRHVPESAKDPVAAMDEERRAIKLMDDGGAMLSRWARR